MTSFIDPMSSPDPLGDGDEVPSSLRTVTRRMARTHVHPYSYPSSSLAVPNSTPSLLRSPRKQTFELDVGNETSPQRILVTVEAEESRGRRSSGLSRRLFANASPSRSVSRRREMATTTTVPVRGLTDDEGAREQGPTPRRRGRPLGSKNGTPAPRGKKRAGTPLRRTSAATRMRTDSGPDTSKFSDALADAGINNAGETPKPKPRKGKTPRKANTPAIPSSKPTGRKRGRPRKSLLSEDVTSSVRGAGGDQSEVVDTDMLPNEDVPMLGEAPSEAGAGIDEDQTFLENGTARDDASPPIRSSLQDEANNSISDRARQKQPAIATGLNSDHDETSIHRPRADDFDDFMDDDYGPLQEQRSDSESDGEDMGDGLYSGQDNLTHASEFSMIAVENLPSFQASFQANQSGMMQEHYSFAEAGDETNMIINQTLESLRRSTQTENQGEQEPEPIGEPNLEDRTVTAADGNEADTSNQSFQAPAQSSPAEIGSSPPTWSHNLKKSKQLPLSRQIFAGKAPHVDDSFSSVPESVLQAATPGRLPMKPTPTAFHNDDSNVYDDSFSEVPEDVLAEATPKPPTRSARLIDEDDTDRNPALESEPQSASRSTNIGSDRLPTPENTNSSTTGSKNAAEEEALRAAATVPFVPNTSDLNIPSSPPAVRQQMTAHDESEYSQLDQHVTGTPPGQGSSPQVPGSKSDSAESAQQLMPPQHHRRPTLSPIVRVGRTLQSVMTDRSSPEGRESSLGSPFRGSGQNDSRQSSVTKSPVRDNASISQSATRSILNPVFSLAQSIRAGFGQNPQQLKAPAVVGPVDDPFRPGMHDYSQMESIERPTHEDEEDVSGADLPNNNNPTMPSSTGFVPPSDDQEMNWAPEDSSPSTQRSRRLSASQHLHAINSSLIGAQSANANTHQLMEVENADEDQKEPEHEIFQEEQEIEAVEGQGEDRMEEAQEMEVDYHVSQEQMEDRQRSEEQTEEDYTGNDTFDEDNDDVDLWDVEASRPTPRPSKTQRAEARARRESRGQGPPAPVPASIPAQTTAEPPRRNKPSSPWRRVTRRLIYQDDFKSPSQIELEGSPLREEEEVPLLPRPAQQEEQAPEMTQEGQAEQSRQFSEQSPNPPARDSSPAQQSDDIFDQLVEQSYQQPSPPPPQPQTSQPQVRLQPQLPPQDESANVEPEDYSQVTQRQEIEEPPAQAKPAPPKKGFFSAFDIMSFFSSPAALPKSNAAQGQIDETPIAQKPQPRPQVPQSAERSVVDEPQSVQRAAGLFPPIPQKTFQPSPERRVDLFSPGTTLRSAGTVADTYATSPTTPERQEFPSIQQKQNFTPLSGQSRNTASLFTPTPRSTRETRTPSPEQESYDEPYEPRDDSPVQEDESSFERIPPREKPSTWDKTLSPTKSCLRSPLKPRTPGKVVEFSGAIFHQPLTHVEERVMRPSGFGSGFGGNIIAQAPVLSAIPENEENSTSPSSASRTNTAPNLQPRVAFAPPTKPTPNTAATVEPTFALSQTVWTKPHWIFLDELLQLRRHDPLSFQLHYPLSAPSSPRKQSLRGGGGSSGNPRQQHPLQGKEVTAGEEKMILEAWHLEIVEAFRQEVGGWDDKTLAKRLFALIVGEQRRRAAKIWREGLGQVVV